MWFVITSRISRSQLVTIWCPEGGDVKIPLAFIYKKTHKIVIHNSVTYTELTDRKTLTAMWFMRQRQRRIFSDLGRYRN